MAIFSQSGSKKDTPAPAKPGAPQANTDFAPASLPRPPADPNAAPRESVIAPQLTIEGKIEGSGHVRIAGRFKGDVNVQGDVTIDKGAKLEGTVRARRVVVSGELDGEIASASRVELTESAAVTGNIKVGQLVVAPGARIRGQIDCGWEAAAVVKPTAPAQDAPAEQATQG